MWLHSWLDVACNSVQLQHGENLPLSLAFPQEFCPHLVCGHRLCSCTVNQVPVLRRWLCGCQVCV